MRDLLLDLVFPKLCQGCSAEGTYFCLVCQSKIKPPQERCLVCDKPAILGQVHGECPSNRIHLNGLMVAADYENEAIRNLIWHFKYNSIREISEILSTLMVDYFIKYNLVEYFAASAVIPVPLHRNRKRARGFNQAEAMAFQFAKKLGFDYLSILERTSNTQSQVELERNKRWQNVQGQFQTTETLALAERKIVLIDDVAATGATLNECAKVLQKQNPLEIWGLVVARN